MPCIMGNPRFARTTGLVLSVVNEYDLVPRADGPYVRSLVDLYRSFYNLPPIQDDAVQQQQQHDHAAATYLPRFSFDTRDTEQPEASHEHSGAQVSVWPLPKPEYWHVGKLVVFKVQLKESPAGNVESSGGGDDGLVLRAVAVGPERFATLLFCNVGVHRRICYQERVDMLLEGRFNGKGGWQ